MTESRTHDEEMAAALLLSAPIAAFASPDRVLFQVTEKTDGVVTAKPSLLVEVGQSASLRFADGVFVEVHTDPAAIDGRSWTKVRLTSFETPEAKYVQEWTMHHVVGVEFTDPTNRKLFVVAVKRAE